MPDYYTGSKGRQDIMEMHPAHLKSAMLKLQRTNPGSKELPAMVRLQAMQQEEYDAKLAEEKAAEQLR